MEMWIALHFRALELEVFIPHWQHRAALFGHVVLAQQSVTACSASAAEAGIVPGMRSGAVQMLMPTAKIFEQDMHKQAAALLAAASALLQYTPQVSLIDADRLVLNVGASLRLFGGLPALRRRIRATMAALGYQVSLGCAPHAKAACLLALDATRQGRAGQLCLQTARLARRLDRLPVTLLDSAHTWRDLLHGLGCYCLRELRALPRPGLQRRCGLAFMAELDLVYAATATAPIWILIPDEFEARLELPERLDSSDLLLKHCQSLLAQLHGWLAAHRLSALMLRLSLSHERGRNAIPASILDISLPAGAQEKQLLALLHEKLHRFDFIAPVIALQLTVPRTQAAAPQSASLFAEPGGQPEDHHHLLALLSTRLGADQVLQAAPLADHRPDLANRWISALEKAPSKLLPTPTLLRPAWLLATAAPLQVRQHRPYFTSPLNIISAPERIEAAWWSEQTELRDYFIAVSASHVRYWIYRPRSGTAAQASWLLHGVFG
ncbi:MULTISPECIES: DNA polymerase Y family protein [unclassified Undibacterium]|uniref:Y-family DNA polymerase n=1 Tax=unclassified Undibacterium TaxID=2630295 RepID=UPI002AC96504|nr:MULTISPECIES: DNA polymerase Y family protein [unclassified Undibacterium]MEB0217304.1 DNA polymerase Y family protein [Undibacterium sp. 5I2]WPX43021.1 DNA polymerase Y family protein [Undibacterium sp. CCC3.4]